MWFSKVRALEDIVAALRAENSDLRQQVRFLTQAAHDRETGLIDRILALTHPAAHREIHPPPPRRVATPAPGNGEHQHRVHHPGVGMTPPPAPRPVLAGTGTGPQPVPPPDEEPVEGVPEDAS